MIGLIRELNMMGSFEKNARDAFEVKKNKNNRYYNFFDRHLNITLNIIFRVLQQEQYSRRVTHVFESYTYIYFHILILLHMIV